MKKIFIVLVASLTVLASLTNCTSKFEEINTDPDAFVEAPNTNMLGNVLRYTAQQWLTNLDIGQWAGYISEVQYLNDYGGYIPSNNTYGNRWYESYYGNVQLQHILDNTADNPEGNKNMRNVCSLMQTWLLLICTDCFGDIPYSDAFKGAPEDGGILQTKYDSQSEVYVDLLDRLEEVSDSWASGIGPDKLGEGDFYFGGDVEMWQRYCNSLRLRYAMRLVNVMYDKSKATVEKILGDSAKYPVIDDTSGDALFVWQGSDPYFEPWYDNSLDRDDDGMSDIFIDHLKSKSDPRISKLAKPAASDGEYRGAENGALVQVNKMTISRIGALYRDIPSGFSVICYACENYFIQCEAALLGWKVPKSAKETYEAGVKASMIFNGVDDSDITAYLAGNGVWPEDSSLDNKKSTLYFEWWVGLFKDNIEAWSLYRRTGYPTYIHTSKALDGVTPKYPGARCAFGTAHNDVPFRWAYPQNQYNYNRENVEAAAAGIVDYVWGKQLWWDKRTDVH